MYKNLIKISTVDMPREEWLKHRRRSVGGSDAASIIGLNPWSSPYSVWVDKLGKMPEKPDTEPMRLGRDLEDYVAKRFTEATGKKVRRENAILQNPDYPFAHANVDRMVVGEDAGLECKTTSALNLKRFKNGEYPEHYYVQCVHYMAITGCKKWYLAVLVLGEGFYHFEIERDEDEIRSLMVAEADFWQCVATETPPMTDGTRATSTAIGLMYPESNEDEGAVDLMSYESELQQYMALSAQIKELEELKEEKANRIKAFMGDSGKGESGLYRVSYASAERSSFDAKRYAKEHPEADLTPYYKKSSYRTFKITEKKEK